MRPIAIIVPVVLLSLKLQAQETQTYFNNEKTFLIEVPLDMQVKRTMGSDFVGTYPGNTSISWEVETYRFMSKKTVSTMKEFARGQEKSLRDDAANGTVINKAVFENLNGKEWWVVDYVKNRNRFIAYQIIEGLLRYSVYYIAPESSVNPQGLAILQQILQSFKILDGKIPEGYVVNSKKEKQATGNVATTAVSTKETSSNFSPVAEPVVKQSNGNTQALKNTRKLFNTATYDTSFQNTEAANIKAFGKGKVKRISAQQLEFVLLDGKKVIVKDKYNERFKSYDPYGTFTGYSDSLNSFLLTGEDGTARLVNRKTGVISDEFFLYELQKGIWSPDNKTVAMLGEYEGETEVMKIYSIAGGSLKKKYEISNEEGKGFRDFYWLDDQSLQLEKASVTWSDNGKLYGPSIGLVWVINKNNQWVLSEVRPVTTATLVPSVTNTPTDVMPYVKPKNVLGAKTADELGTILFDCIKTNNADKYYSYIAVGTKEEAVKSLSVIRKELAMQGLANWMLAKKTRVTYHDEDYMFNDPNRELFWGFVIEFTYGTQFEGFICGNTRAEAVIELKGGKYYLQRPLKGTKIYNKNN